MKPVYLLLFVLAASCTSKPTSEVYQVAGNAGAESAGQQVILEKFDPINQVATAIDTATVSPEGQFVLDYAFSEPELLRLAFPSKKKVLLVIQENETNVEVNADGQTDSCSACSIISAYESFREASFKRLVKPKDETLDAVLEAGKSATDFEVVKAYSEASAEHRKELIDFAKENMQDSPALYAAALRWTDEYNLDELADLVNAFEAQFPDLEMTKNMQAKVQRFVNLQVGNTAPAFRFETVSGQEQSASESYGDLTLIDFWASWCGPCLVKIPQMQAIYDEYKAKGFEVVAFSLDTNDKKWQDAIEKYALEWVNGSDLKGYKSPVAVDYNVTLIPFNVLVDAEGKIIEKSLSVERLEEILEERL